MTSSVYVVFALALLPFGRPGAARAQSAPPQRAVRVAVFAEAGFPTRVWDGEASFPPPPAIVHHLQSLGIDAEAVNAATLADVSKFNSVQLWALTADQTSPAPDK